MAACALLASRLTYVPLWDGRIYADCIVDAAVGRLAPSTLRCSEHASHAYMLFAGAIQMLSPGSYPLMLVANGLLYVASCFAFFLIARLAFPGPAHDVGRALLGVAFALHPAVLASVVLPTIDFPLLPAFLWGVVFVLRGQRAWLIAVGLAMVFTKETGVVLYAALVGTYALFTLFGPGGPAGNLRGTLRASIPLAIPLAVFAAYLAYRATIPQATVVWAAGTTHQSIAKRFIVPRIDRPLASFLVMMLVLNFAWIATAVVGADALVGARRFIARAPARALEGTDGNVVRFLVVLGLVAAYALTRFTTYANTRYVLVALALLPVVMYASLVRLGVGAVPRALVTGTLAAGFAISTVASVDPVSRTLYGTFALGDRSLFRLTRITHECCGAGRDQLVYNLQFTKLADLLSDAMVAVRAGDSTTVFVPHNMLWETLGKLDSATLRRTLRRTHTVWPPLLEPDSLATRPTPPRAVFLALPNGDVAQGMKALSAHYLVGPPRRVSRGAYWLDVYPLTSRDASLHGVETTARGKAPLTTTHERSSTTGG
jgi:hypothetical protein